MRGGSKADRYERLYPGVAIPAAQKEERMERIDFKAERASHGRTGRNRGIVVPGGAAFDENGRLRP